MTNIAVLTTGLWRLRGEIEALTSMTPVRWHSWPRPSFDAVAGWGHAPTTAAARRLAQRSGKPYVAFEDGPLRSVRPGPSQAPMSLVADRTGIYYDSAAPSDLGRSLAERAWFTPAVEEDARAACEQLRRLRLSKYNSGVDRSPGELGLDPHAAQRVLVLDQVRDDASIRGALADAGCFEAMLAAALEDNPDAEIVVKQHPDVLSGRRSGYFPAIVAAGRVKPVAESVNPWSLLDAVDSVYTVSSGLGFEAVLAGKRVVCHGSPFYAGYGFTEDRLLRVTRPAPARPIEVFAAYYLRYAHYFDAYSRAEIDFETAADQLAWLRDRFVGQRRRAVGYRITRWKRRTVARMLDGPAGPALFAPDIPQAVALARRHGGEVVAWASRDNRRLATACADAAIPLVRAEDGFLRSVGLGASFVPPLSLVFDSRGIYYDSGAASALEDLLQTGEFPPELLARAERLRKMLVASGTTKYNVLADADVRIDGGGREILLVPGQVEDDASIERGSPHIRSNLGLLEAVRARHPRACVVYKPHPDVEAGFRRGRVPPKLTAAYADHIVTRAPILRLIEACDRVETLTSLAGFEALLRGKPVATLGQPFYAGWGLTEDVYPVTRRTRRRSLDELVAAALILYPRYLDPVSGLPCPPELLVQRLAAAGSRQRTAGEKLLRLVGTSTARALHIGHSMKRLARRG